MLLALTFLRLKQRKHPERNGVCLRYPDPKKGEQTGWFVRSRRGQNMLKEPSDKGYRFGRRRNGEEMGVKDTKREAEYESDCICFMYFLRV